MNLDDEDENQPVWPTWSVGGRPIQMSKRTTADARLRVLSGDDVLTPQH
jgi:hypothetical protein